MDADRFNATAMSEGEIKALATDIIGRLAWYATDDGAAQMALKGFHPASIPRSIMADCLEIAMRLGAGTPIGQPNNILHAAALSVLAGTDDGKDCIKLSRVVSALRAARETDEQFEIRASPETGPEPWRSGSCDGETCSICGAPAAAKIGEEIMDDDPVGHRHNLTAYVCAGHFRTIMGQAGPDMVESWRSSAPVSSAEELEAGATG